MARKASVNRRNHRTRVSVPRRTASGQAVTTTGASRVVQRPKGALRIMIGKGSGSIRRV